MNISFVNIRKTVVNGEEYMGQRAIVTNNRPFWIAWKQQKEELSKFLSIRREIIQGNHETVVYRLLPLRPDRQYGPMPSKYTLKSTKGLLPYQPRAVERLCSVILKYGAAADVSDTGLGKTYVAAKVCEELLLRPGIVCKVAGIATWKKVCKEFNISPLFIVNWELAKNGKFPYVFRTQDNFTGQYSFNWGVPQNTLLIFDEAHMANHDDSINSCLYTGSYGIPSISISATFADKVERLKPLFHVLRLKKKEEFKEWMFEIGQRFTNWRGEDESISVQSDLLEANRHLFPSRGIRLTYEDADVAGYFPGKAVFQTSIITLSTKATNQQNSAYRKLIARAQELSEMGHQAEKLVEQTRFRQMSELLKAPTIAEMVKNYIAQGHSVSVFVNYTETLAYLAKALNTKSLVFGQQEKYKISREEVIDNFQKERTRVILCMAEAGGASISLHDLTGNHPRISLVCPTYNPVTLKQILGRTYRAKTVTKPIIKLVYAAGTVEERVAESVNVKLGNISALNDGDLMEPDLFNLGVE